MQGSRRERLNPQSADELRQAHREVERAAQRVAAVVHGLIESPKDLPAFFHQAPDKSQEELDDAKKKGSNLVTCAQSLVLGPLTRSFPENEG